MLEGFRTRLLDLEARSGLSERGFAESLGLSLTTYRNIKRGGAQGPALGTLYSVCTKIGAAKFVWLLTGQEEGQAQAVECPPPGYDLIRLPRVDPRMLSPGEADNLEKALVVLRGEGEAKHLASALQTNIETMHKAALATPSQAYEQSEPGKGKKRA